MQSLVRLWPYKAHTEAQCNMRNNIAQTACIL
jgi:hypothetical protein